MKIYPYIFLLILPLFSQSKDLGPFQMQNPAERNLSEEEIRNLPESTTFKDVESRIRYYTRPAIAIPAVSFKPDGEEGHDCLMVFDVDSNKLLLAVRISSQDESEEDSIVLWPKEHANKKLSDVVEKLAKE